MNPTKSGLVQAVSKALGKGEREKTTSVCLFITIRELVVGEPIVHLKVGTKGRRKKTFNAHCVWVARQV